MAWNYRVIDFGDRAAVHEVHYGADGTPLSYSERSAEFSVWREHGDGPDKVADMLARALEGALKPVLRVEDFTRPALRNPETVQ